MAGQSPAMSISTSRYPEFQVPKHDTISWKDSTTLTEVYPITILDEDGATLYEDEWGLLLLTIIKLNDVATLNRSLAKHPRSLGPGETHGHDPFWTAASYGSTDALRVLLEHYAADPTQTQAPDARGYLLLNVACRSAHVDTVRFLLDCQPAFGDIHAREAGGITPLLSAAESFVNEPWQTNEGNDRQDSIRDCVARSKELVQLLLDRGACTRNAITSIKPDNKPRQLHGTVLSLAISRASSKLLKRLIDEEADCAFLRPWETWKTSFHSGCYPASHW